ncbi:hypothetical protein PC129_g7381 [Phytophthora cactorum]|uniref:HAT C-terminal dimerisation domain-containing protein n=1 Tax=Phytophthora cactorum TaxID=29920 RepID=A0A8T1IBH5_9STRA|nr:hypothetical protein PC112_g4516 [Phytophthora cactorum]KAG2840088.1 hypothetical protein PC111_g3635 [Phytophthora cactorum]KAG2865137.1 hypothetical protein PC113_g3970 [Phytophthora cactorum]KAG2935484.1 hypothetical protein PC114_g476 [Phytophthora cactorum]KAG2941718.1 hypothetical protein PC115_g1814 [Phytophthora cactorum]
MEGKPALVLPADTRWGTIERCFASVHRSEKIFHAFATSRNFLWGRNKEQKAKRRHDYDTVVAKDFWHGSNQEEAVLLELLKYLGTAAKQSVEVTLVHKKKLSVFQYWNGRSQFPLWRDIAQTVFSASCSSAAAERNFSAHKFVQSQARNRLQDASVEKLVFLLFNAKNFDNEDMAFYEMIDVLADASEDEDSSNEDSDFEYY